MTSVQDVMETQKRIEDSVTSWMEEYDKSLKTALNPDSKITLDKLARDYKSFKDIVWAILKQLRTQIQSLLHQTDELETYNRRNILLFGGIEETDKEVCKSVISNIIHKTMNLTNIEPGSISTCHRLGTKNTERPRPILVRFNDCSSRNTVWLEKKRLKSSSIVLSEFLTRTRQAMFSVARRHFGIHQCWTRDGSIFILLPNNERRRVTFKEELDKLMTDFPPKVKSSNNLSSEHPNKQPLETTSQNSAEIQVSQKARRVVKPSK